MARSSAFEWDDTDEDVAEPSSRTAAKASGGTLPDFLKPEL